MFNITNNDDREQTFPDEDSNLCEHKDDKVPSIEIQQ